MDAKVALEEWHLITSKADWNTPMDITNAFASSRYLGNNRFSFKIKGNHYRLVVKAVFPIKTVFIRFVGTHADYDRIDAATI
jgi:mRNA interferase HigB